MKVTKCFECVTDPHTDTLAAVASKCFMSTKREYCTGIQTAAWQPTVWDDIETGACCIICCITLQPLVGPVIQSAMIRLGIHLQPTPRFVITITEISNRLLCERDFNL